MSNSESNRQATYGSCNNSCSAGQFRQTNKWKILSWCKKLNRYLEMVACGQFFNLGEFSRVFPMDW